MRLHSVRSRLRAGIQYVPPTTPGAVVTWPSAPTSIGTGSNPFRYFLGTMHIAEDTFYGADNFDYPAAYSRRTTLTNNRLMVWMHGTSGGNASVNSQFAPATGFDFELRTIDSGEYSGFANERWTINADGTSYTGRRLAACINDLCELYPEIDYTDDGIVLAGSSLGMGGSCSQVMVLPDPWRARIAYVYGAVGAVLMRTLGAYKYTDWPSDNGSNNAFWDQIDFEALCESDAIVRGMHYRHQFSSNDGQFDLADGTNTQLPWVNLCEAQCISAVCTWVANGHSRTESGINFPDVRQFQGESQVTLDRAHPCFTNSSGNYPDNATDRLNVATYPRGHYNVGLIWDHANTVDTVSEIIIPIRYSRSTGLGGGMPDMPTDITVDVTPRRPRNFVLSGTVHWSFDGGAQTGSGTVTNGVITAADIALTSGAGFKSLRFYKV